MTAQLQSKTSSHDEIISFVEDRYVRSSETAWSMLKFEYVDIQLLVDHLNAHLESHRTVYYQE